MHRAAHPRPGARQKRSENPPGLNFLEFFSAHDPGGFLHRVRASTAPARASALHRRHG
jgi:hypothetical protein